MIDNALNQDEAAQSFVQGLIYSILFEARPLLAIDRLLEFRIYDPISPFPPLERADQIDSILHRNISLTKFFPGDCPHTEEELRELLEAIVTRVRQNGPNFEYPLGEPDDLPETIADDLRFILSPLLYTGTERDALITLKESITKLWPHAEQYKKLTDHILSIRCALKNKIPLERMVDFNLSEAVIRTYLRRTALLLQEIRESTK